MISYKDKNRGFSLLELSIVLIILGLIATVVTAGNAIIKSYQLRSIITDLNSFSTAYNTFKIKYHAVPGDMKNASSYWPSCDSTCAPNCTPASVCDGDGEGRIGDGTVTAEAETFRAWQELGSNAAGLIQGTYLGKRDTSSKITIGTVVPASKYKGGGYLMKWDTAYSRTNNLVEFSAANGLDLGNSVISPQDARSIDNKIDDGDCCNGYLVTIAGADAAANTCINSSAFDLDTTNRTCVLKIYLNR